MHRRIASPLRVATIAALIPALAACGVRANAAAGSQDPAHGAHSSGDTTRRAARADVEFLQDMIPHHAQALVMTAMAPERTRNQSILMLARRIADSQEAEIRLMRQWLLRHGEEAPSGDPEHAHHEGHEDMPGMLSEAELKRLSQSSGRMFDRLFLEFMIRHHEGALIMTGQLFSTPGGGADPELFGLASDIDADQRAEIRRMRALLESGTPG
jgi:uncharacterized protein (DUF305 family)